MLQIFLALRKSLRKSVCILGLILCFLSLFIFIGSPSYAGQVTTEMKKGSQEKIQQKINEKANKVTYGLEEAKQARGADRPLDVEEEQLKKGAVEEAKVLRDLFTGTKPDGTSVFDSNNK